MVQHFLVDVKGRYRPRTKRDGQPPSRTPIESPYEAQARLTRGSGTHWTEYLWHVTETCGDKRISVTTAVPTGDSSADYRSRISEPSH
ncbi:hypothetical protein QNN03_04925 [Streptomyces sp. GXMU-J15]|uniref:Transposase n=1 Tax=Streptomyces fuscus TaxID=3048495 RepID=A0ABT7IUM6_9ACTN|nr:MULTISPECIES: hypothetical protein [Streptomyces]MDL2075777.1 hypothetical protein [Streptomyces fuscus]SBT93352.1 hypothetical protein GA0115233_106230 [Streptomyces sp. DI166]